MAGPALGTIIPALGFLDTIIQDNTLVREYQDALFPSLLYRGDVSAERWEANVGDRQIFTRSSLLSVAPTPLNPGVDPTPENLQFEQWEVLAQQYGNTIDTHLPSSFVALANLFTRTAKQLGLNAGQSLNRLARNKLFASYLGGDTMTTAAAGPTTSLPVASINGFTHTIVNGQLVAVSVATPLSITITGVGTFSVTAAAPASASFPYGPGTLTLSAAATYGANVHVVSSLAPTILRAGGAADIDGIGASDVLNLALIRRGIAELERNRVPPHPDGYYHIHIDPLGVSDVFADNEFQRLNQGVPDNTRYAQMIVGLLLRSLWYSNNESPTDVNTGTQISTRGSATHGDEILAETRNLTGIRILRTIITGGGSIMEKYIDEQAAYISEAGVQGKVGAFSVVNNGLVVPIERTRYIIRAPQDRLQQIVSQSWSATLDFAIPTDLFGGQTGARFKRAVVIEHGTSG